MRAPILKSLDLNENLIIAYFDFPEDNNGFEVCNYIDWHKIETEIMSKEKLHKKVENTIQELYEVESPLGLLGYSYHCDPINSA